MSKSTSKFCSVDVRRLKGETMQQSTARSMLNPLVLAAVTVGDYFPMTGTYDLNYLVEAMEHQVNAIREGHLDRVEEMLVAQAHTLDAVANHLLGRSLIQEQIEHIEPFLRMGLKAQSQCRATLEAVVRMKAPKTLFNQTNIAHNQQVNNDFSAKKQNPPNELMEKTDGERLDTRAPSEAVRVDPELATVGAKYRAKNGRGQG